MVADPISTYSTPGTTSSTTYAYDHNGNLVSATMGTTTTTYVYDYANRLTALGVNSATTTYAYDAFGSRVWQGNGTATTTYPNKFYSIVTSMTGATTTATSTLYAYDGDQLLATTDQVLVNGTAVGTSTTRYVHPDNLGSTQATSNEEGMLAEYFVYAPYGSVLAATSTAGTVSAGRQYIGQFADSSGLSYLNARYYNAAQGQFLSEDPVFLSNPKSQNLADPQSLNSYSYANDNPITKSDPAGLCPQCLLGAGAGILAQYGYDVYHNYSQNGLALSDFYSGLSSPQTYLVRGIQGGVIGASGGLAAGVLGGNLLGQSIAVGATSGLSGALANRSLGDSVTPQSVFWDTALGGLTFGLSELAPAVRGVSPSFGTNAFYMGAHTQQDAMRLGIDSISGYLSALFGTSASLQSFSHSASYQSSGSNSSSGGGASVSGQQFSSLIQVGNAFTPTNATQSQALQNVFQSFAGGK